MLHPTCAGQYVARQLTCAAARCWPKPQDPVNIIIKAHQRSCHQSSDVLELTSALALRMFGILVTTSEDSARSSCGTTCSHPRGSTPKCSGIDGMLSRAQSMLLLRQPIPIAHEDEGATRLAFLSRNHQPHRHRLQSRMSRGRDANPRCCALASQKKNCAPRSTSRHTWPRRHDQLRSRSQKKT